MKSKINTSGIIFSVLFVALITTTLCGQTGPGGVGQRNAQDMLVLWLDAAQGITKDASDNVSVWADQSGYNNDAWCNSSKPSWQSSAVNNLPSVYFDGMYENMTITGDASLQPENITIFAVVKRHGLTGWGDIISRPYYDYNNWNWPYTSYELCACNSFAGQEHDGPFSQVAVGGNKYSNDNPPFDSVPDNEAYIHVLEYDGQNMSSWLNNGLIPGWSAQISAPGQLDYNGNTANISIGTNSSYFVSPASDHYLNGDIAEIIIYDTNITDVDHVIVVNYLSAKYNITIAYDKYAEQTGFTNDIIGIGRDVDIEHTFSEGGYLRLSANSFSANSSYTFAGHNNQPIENHQRTNLPSGYDNRLSRTYYIASTGTKASSYTIAFHLPYGIGGNTSEYGLLFSSNSDMSASTEVVKASSINITERIISFSVTAAQLSDGYYTLGSTVNHWNGYGDTDWNNTANWEGGIVPQSTSDAVIIANPTDGNFPEIGSTPNAEVNNLTIETGAAITVSENMGLTVSGTLTNQNGTAGIILQSSSSGSGSLIYPSGNIDATIRRYVTAGKWHLITPPVSGAMADNFYFNHNPSVWLIKFIENQGQYGDWSYITDLNESIPQPTGLSMWVDTSSKGDVTVEFTGTATANDFTETLDFSGSDRGFNLLGNPFTSPIDFESGSWAFSNVEETVWIWDDDSQSYKHRTSQGLGTMPNGIIPLAQGFFMRTIADANYVTIPADSRVHNTQAYYKKSHSLDSLFFYLMFEVHHAQQKDMAFIGFKKGATVAFDNGWDASKFLLGSGNPLLFFNENNNKLGIDILPVPEPETEKTAILSYIPAENGDDTLFMTHLVNQADMEVFLYDMKTGAVQNMKSTPVYGFRAQIDDDPDRFLLHFIYAANGVTNTNPENNNVKIFSKEGKIYILDKNENPAVKTVFVYDSAGHLIVLKTYKSNKRRIEIPVIAAPQIFMVKIVSGLDIFTSTLFVR